VVILVSVLVSPLLMSRIKLEHKSHKFLLAARNRKVPETLSEEVMGKMGAPPKTDVPVISPQELAEADGILFGFPTRFGMMAAQMKAFFDATGGLWREQSLAGKPAGIFFSTGTQGGGQETTP
jgi:NAD(P)H dehydrogenase (quinone)